ncbi:MAG: septum formation inhibitor Maf [Deltaproteobacteria bacterium]|nr:MAG: septum formation inhibitor Maf [Deltaproteobacteria bacterium]
MSRLILASASPRRKELLKQVGLDFTTIPSKIEERMREGEDFRQYPLRISLEKALSVIEGLPRANGCWVIAADTIVVIDSEILGKPKDPEDARSMLEKLSDREHLVITGFSVVNAKSKDYTQRSVESRVKLKKLAPDEIEGYLKTREPFDKAGGYAVQGIGSFMVERVNGSYTNVVGLPMSELIQVLREMRAVDLFEKYLSGAPPPAGSND